MKCFDSLRKTGLPLTGNKFQTQVCPKSKLSAAKTSFVHCKSLTTGQRKPMRIH